jgi:hypothetical protein
MRIGSDLMSFEVNKNPHHQFLRQASRLIPAEFAETKAGWRN